MFDKQISRREMLKLTAALGAGAAFTSACGSTPVPTSAPQPTSGAVATVPPAPTAEPVNITWLEWWGTSWGFDRLAWLTDGFMAKYPNIKLTMEDVTWNEYLAKLQTAGLSGMGWDVMGLESSWMIQAETWGMIEDLTPWLEQAGPEFNDRLTNMTKVIWKGKPYMMYLYLIPFNCNYRPDKLEAMGLEPPTNWEEFYDACKAFRDKGEYGFSYSLKANSTQFISKMWGLRLAQAGGKIVDDDGQVAFNSDAGVIATEWWKRFYQSDLALPGSEAEDKTTTTENIATGKIAMTIDGPYERANAQQIVPDVDIRWCPAWKAETGGYCWGGSGIGMWAKGEHKEEAWKFIEYFYQDDVMVHLAKEVNHPMAVNAVFEQDMSNDPVLHALPAMQNQDPEHNWAFRPTPEAGTLYGELTETVLACMKGEKTNIKAALDEVAGVWQKTLDQYQ